MKEQITDSDTVYALEIVNRICDRVGPGLSGSSKERERAAIIEKELILHLGEKKVIKNENKSERFFMFYCLL